MRTAMRLGAAVIGAVLMMASPAAAQMSNDNFENAASLGPEPTTMTGTVEFASRQFGEPAEGQRTVWYAFRPTVAGRYAVELRDFGSMSGNLGVYTGPAMSALSLVGHAQYFQPRVAFAGAAGVTYWVVVSDLQSYPYMNGTGPFSLRLMRADPPANDALADAKRIKVARTYTGTIADATAELGEPQHAGHGPFHSVWFRFRSHGRARMTIDSGGSGTGTTLAAYTGSDVSRLRVVADDASGSPTGTGSVIRFIAKPDTTYRVALDAYGTDVGYGEYRMYLSDGGVRSKGIKLGVRSGQTVASVRSRGLRTIVSAQRKATVRLDLVVSRRAAHRLHLSSPVLGSIRGVVDYGQQLPAVITLKPAAAKALRGHDALSAKVQLTILNSITPDRTLTRPIDLPM